jgi:putative flavoprotein involved in K+ transport
VVATGAFTLPRTPDFAGQLDPAIRQLHSSEYRNPSQLQDGPVLVVGVSHSGADVAFEAARTHRTLLAGHAHGELPFRVIDTRRAWVVWPLVVFVASHVLTMRTPIGRKMAPFVRTGGGPPLLRIRSGDLAEAGVERFDARVVSAQDGKPVLADGQVLDVANVIWCTGFQPDYGWIRVPDFVGEDGWPIGVRGAATAPGLYFLGVPFTYGFTSMLVAGAGRDAAYVADRIAERARGTEAARGMAPARVAR